MKNGHKVIKGRPLEDRIGPYIGFCFYPEHVGIVMYCQYKKCEKIKCEHYVKFRPEDKEFTDIMVAIDTNQTEVQISTKYRR